VPLKQGCGLSSMNHDSYPDDLIRSILNGVRTIALVGASNNPARPSYIVVKYLSERGYTIIPVNPGLAGQEILGLKVYASLKDIPVPLDMVEIFRNSTAAGPITDEALALDPLPRVIWMQLSVRNDEAAARAEARGVTVIMNRCPKIEFGRLSGEIGWQGINSRILSSKKPVMSAKGIQKRSIGIAPGVNPFGTKR
jgi:predicted CoA-binding protein